MKLAEFLIDKAVKMCNDSYSELARRIEVYPTDITKLKQGKRPLSPEIAAELAEVAGLDARQAAIDAIIERNAANRKGALLADILGKAQAVGAAAMLGISYSGDSTIDTATIKNDSAVVKDRIHRIYRRLRENKDRSGFAGLSLKARRLAANVREVFALRPTVRHA